MADPAENPDTHTPMATVNCAGSWNMLRNKESVDGAIVAPAIPEQGAGGDQHLGTGGKSGEQRRQAEQGCADQHELAAADAIAERAHGEQRAGNQEAVNVDDPEQLRARGRQIAADCRYREVQHGQVHGVEQRRQEDHGEADPLSSPGLGCGHLLHETVLMVGTQRERQGSDPTERIIGSARLSAESNVRGW